MRRGLEGVGVGVSVATCIIGKHDMSKTEINKKKPKSGCTMVNSFCAIILLTDKKHRKVPDEETTSWFSSSVLRKYHGVQNHA